MGNALWAWIKCSESVLWTSYGREASRYSSTSSAGAAVQEVGLLQRVQPLGSKLRLLPHVPTCWFCSGGPRTTCNVEHTHTHTKSSGRPLISVAHCQGGAISHMFPANLPTHKPASQTSRLELWHQHVRYRKMCPRAPEWHLQIGWLKTFNWHRFKTEHSSKFSHLKSWNFFTPLID